MDLEILTSVTEAEILQLVSVATLKAHLRIPHALEDGILQDCILDAYSYFDGPSGWLRRSVLRQTFLYYRPDLPDSFELPMSPLVSVSVVTYRNEAGNYQVIASDTYEAGPGTLFGTVSLARNKTWPTSLHTNRPYRVEFVAGWTAATCPGGIRRAIKMLAGSLYQHREADFEDNRVSSVSRKVEYGLEKLAGRWRIPNDLVPSF